MSVPSKAMWIGIFYSLAMFLLCATLARASIGTDGQERTIRSTRAGDLLVTLTNESGKFTADVNRFCVLFQSKNASTAIDIHEVSVDFRLLVGRIQERPLTVHLSPNGFDRFCGDINLGRQYYRPANYYVLVHYSQATGKKRTARMSVIVR